EDRIRDRNVTGVQTCALPISVPPGVSKAGGLRPARLREGAAMKGKLHRFTLEGRPCACFVPQGQGPFPLAVLCGWSLADKLPLRSEERRVGMGSGTAWGRWSR